MFSCEQGTPVILGYLTKPASSIHRVVCVGGGPTGKEDGNVFLNSWLITLWDSTATSCNLQGYLAHKKTPTSLSQEAGGPTGKEAGARATQGTPPTSLIRNTHPPRITIGP